MKDKKLSIDVLNKNKIIDGGKKLTKKQLNKIRLKKEKKQQQEEEYRQMENEKLEKEKINEYNKKKFNYVNKAFNFDQKKKSMNEELNLQHPLYSNNSNTSPLLLNHNNSSDLLDNITNQMLNKNKQIFNHENLSL